MTYCETTDLLVGTNTPLPPDPAPQNYVNGAANEIDMILARRYVVPVVATDQSTTILLKNLNAWIATARLVMAETSGAEQTQVNAYAKQLLDEAKACLKDIDEGRLTLLGAQTKDSEDQGRSGPIIANLDTESNVESFYNMVNNPTPYPLPRYPIYPGGANPVYYTW